MLIFILLISLISWKVSKNTFEFFIFVVIGFLISIILTDLIRDYDAYLYHLQAVRWAKEGFLHLGIANIHSRFGFQSLWFGLHSHLDLSGVFGYPLPLLNGLVALFSLSFLAKKALEKSKDWFAYTTLGIVLLLSTLDGSLFYLLRGYNPDIPAAFIMFYYFYCIYMSKVVDARLLKKLTAISLLALLIKLSTIPLILYTTFLLARSLLLSTNKKPYLQLFGVIVVVVGYFMIQNVLLSGYLVFPVAFTQLPVSWAVPREEVASLSGVISSWAKIRAVNSLYTTPFNLDWIPTWYSQQTAQSLVTILGGVISTIGISLVALQQKSKKKEFISLGVWGLLAYWFFIAPDIRFGLGIFFVALFIFMSELIQNKYTNFAYTLGIMYMAILIAVVPPITNYYHWFRMVPKIKPWGLQSFPTKEVVVYGNTYYIPLEEGEDRTNYQDFPSAPQIDPCLKQKKSGPFTIHYKECN